MQLELIARDPIDIDPAFGHWLAGFVDGEGCFRIVCHPRKGDQPGFYVRCIFSIGLRGDDLPILKECRDRTGLGRVWIHRPPSLEGTTYAQWHVSGRTHCLLLVEIFRRFPLRAKKARDFEIWQRAVAQWNHLRRGSPWYPLTESECAVFQEARRSLETIRQFTE